ncbi:MAG: hypothetical protein ACLPY1_10625 [Terracidiphilus sp.]
MAINVSLLEDEILEMSAEDADRYLDEATRCYFFGLFTPCAERSRLGTCFCSYVFVQFQRQTKHNPTARLLY